MYCWLMYCWFIYLCIMLYYASLDHLPLCPVSLVRVTLYKISQLHVNMDCWKQGCYQVEFSPNSQLASKQHQSLTRGLGCYVLSTSQICCLCSYDSPEPKAKAWQGRVDLRMYHIRQLKGKQSPIGYIVPNWDYNIVFVRLCCQQNSAVWNKIKEKRNTGRNKNTFLYP